MKLKKILKDKRKFIKLLGVIFLLFLIFSNISFTQIYKIKSSSISTSIMENDIWQNWRDWVKTDVLIQINKKKNTLEIFDKARVYEKIKKGKCSKNEHFPLEWSKMTSFQTFLRMIWVGWRS